MSKPIVKVERKNTNSLQNITNSAPAIREVNVPVINEDKNNIITTYKDLNQPLLELAERQKKNLFIAFFIFLILGLGIMMGQKYGPNRIVASKEMSKLVPSGAEITNAEHYHYDKSCYKGANGEQVCMTRTSQKR